MTTTLYVCDTCRYDSETREHGGRNGGAIFAEHIEAQLAQRPLRDLDVCRTSCLMACARHCTVHLRAPGKIQYVIGNFEPTAECAATLLDYVEKFQASASGQVPYAQWPAGIKGHFIARTPPPDSSD